jgi:hypothetical protein
VLLPNASEGEIRDLLRPGSRTVPQSEISCLPIWFAPYR